MTQDQSHLQIGERKIGLGEPCFIIAEAGVNHDGDLDAARALVDAAVAAGADAVKFQSFSADELVTPDAPKAEYQKASTDAAESQRDMLHRLQLCADDHKTLHDYCDTHGIIFLSSPFGMADADLLAGLGVPAFKIPSGEITNVELLEHVARFGKPVIMSSGMASLGEVQAAVAVLHTAGAREIAVLHCVSNYPADPADANLKAIGTMAETLGLPIGYSDHTLGCEVSFAAVALGACIIEKHLTLGRGRAGPDHEASLPPDEFQALCAGIRIVESALGSGVKEPAAAEAPIAAIARRSLIAAADIPMGSTIDADMIAARRPGTGIPPTDRDQVVGRTAKLDIGKDTLITREMLT